MIDKKFLTGLLKQHKKHDQVRQEIIKRSQTNLHEAKRVIFSLHRLDKKMAKKNLALIEKDLLGLQKQYGFERLNNEGSYRAALEEYVEAKFFCNFLLKEKIEKNLLLEINFDSYLGGLCDLVGELARFLINQGAEKKYSEVERAKNAAEEIMSELVKFDMTGYLRTKYDQAKNSLKKIEQVYYEIKLRF